MQLKFSDNASNYWYIERQTLSNIRFRIPFNHVFSIENFVFWKIWVNEHAFYFLHTKKKVYNPPVFTKKHKIFKSLFFPSTTIEWNELDTNFENS